MCCLCLCVNHAGQKNTNPSIAIAIAPRPHPSTWAKPIPQPAHSAPSLIQATPALARPARRDRGTLRASMAPRSARLVPLGNTHGQARPSARTATVGLFPTQAAVLLAPLAQPGQLVMEVAPPAHHVQPEPWRPLPAPVCAPPVLPGPTSQKVAAPPVCPALREPRAESEQLFVYTTLPPFPDHPHYHPAQPHLCPAHPHPRPAHPHPHPRPARPHPHPAHPHHRPSRSPPAPT